MKFKRILSLLLSATLITSCLPITALAYDVGAVSDSEDVWVTGDGSATEEVTPTDTAPYISLTGRDNSTNDVLFYKDTTSGKYSTRKDYTISFKIRTREFISGETTEEAAAGKISVAANKARNGVALGDITLTSEWAEIEYTVKKGTNGFNGSIYFAGSKTRYSVAPIEIKDFSIVEKGAAENLALNADKLFADGAGWDIDSGDTDVKTLNVDVVSDSKYMSVSAPASGVVSIKNSSTEVLPAGIYIVSGDFRLSKIDRSLYTFDSAKNLESDGNITPITFKVNGNAVPAVDGDLINAEGFTAVSYRVVLTEPVSKDSFVFSANTNCGLDFRNIKIEDKSADFNTELQTSDGELLGKPSLDGDSYIRISGRDHADDVVYYKDTVTEYDSGKTYTVSFKIRTRDYISHDDTSIADYPAYVRIYTNSRWGNAIDSGFKLTSDWVSKSYDVSGFNGQLYFASDWHGQFMVPYDIKDFTVVEKGTSDNLAVNADKPFESGAGWEIYSDSGKGIKTFSVYTMPRNDCYVVPAGDAGTTAFTFTDTTPLAAGIYHISGSFMLADREIDFNKYVFQDTGILSADENGADLEVIADGNAIEALDGGKTAKINSECWSDAAFKLTVSEGDSISPSDIMFTLAESVDLYVKDVTITEASAYYDTTFVTSDGQPLTIPSVEGDSYIRIGGRDSAEDVVYYKDTVTAYDPEKTYTVSFQIRTRDYIPHEDTAIADYPAYVRVYTNSRWGTAIDSGFKLTPNWTSKSYDVVGFNGQLYFASDWHGQFMLPYDIKNFTVVEKGTTDNLAVNADKPFTDGAGWEIYTNSGMGIKSLDVSTMPRNDYKIVPAGVAGFTFADTTPLKAGIYHLSGSFMLADDTVIDFNKYVFKDVGTLLEDNNSAAVEISVDGKEVKTLDGETSVKINSESWSNATFKFIVSDGDSISPSDIMFTLSDSAKLFVKDIILMDASEYYVNDFVDGEGNAPAIVDGSEDELYIAVNGRDSNQDMFGYSVTGINAGTYTVRFNVRTKPFIPSDDPNIGSNPAAIRANYVLNGTSMGAITTFYNLTSDWAVKEFNITVDTDSSDIMLRFNGAWQGYGYAPIDIKDFGIVNTETGENVAVNASGLLENGCGWSTQNSGGSRELTVSLSTDVYHYRVSAPETGNTKLGLADDAVLEPGIYHITGSFRLVNNAPIDYSKYSGGSVLTSDGNIISAEMTAMAGMSVLASKSGAKVTVNSGEWRTVTFILDTVIPVNMSDICLMLDGAYGLDFKDVSIEIIEKHIEMTPFGSTVLMVLTAYMRKQMEALGLNAPWIGSDGTSITTVDKVLDEATGLVGDKKGAAANSYIHVSGRDNNSDQIVYKNTAQNLAPGTYNLTFWLRTSEMTNTSANLKNGRNPVSVIRLFITSGWKQLSDYAITRSGAFDTAFNTQLNPTTDWTKYSYTFKLDAETPFIFWFGGNNQGYGVAPFDIDGFTLVKVDPKTYKPLTGENLAINSDKLMGAKAGWSVVDAGKANLTTEVNSVSESEFMRVKATEGSSTITVKNKGAKLEPGKYYITTKVRLSAVDYLKYEYDETQVSLLADNNKAIIKATLDGNTLKTTIDKDSAEITGEWSVVSFVVDVKEETTMKKLKLTVEGAESVDFDYINVSTKISKTDKDSLAPAADGTVALPPVEVDTDGNLLEGAIDEETVAYWSYGDQKLELKRDKNGVPYFTASNITSNTLGFTYNPRFSLRPGTYTFKADVRTANEGEKGALRVMIGELYNTVAINDEWKTVQFEFTVPDEMSEFSIKLRGGAFATSIQDYEFKNLSLISVVSTLKGLNLFENGDFNDEEAAIETWYFGRSSGKLIVNTEGDNKFLTSSERVDCNSATDAKVGHTAFAGVKYKISYDIRTSHEGDTMQARTSVVAGGANTDLNFNGGHFFDITHEWMHVEYTYTPAVGGEMILRIAGGWRGEPDDKDYDIDNIRIEIIG